MEKQKPEWWNEYFRPFPKEEQDFYEENKSKITNSIMEIDAEKGIRKRTYSGKGIETTVFTDTY